MPLRVNPTKSVYECDECGFVMTLAQIYNQSQAYLNTVHSLHNSKHAEWEKQKTFDTFVLDSTGAFWKQPLIVEKQPHKTLYLVKILSHCKITQELLQHLIGRNALVQSVEETTPPASRINTVETAVEAIVKAGYRQLAMQSHPDLGGSQETMALLNRAKKELIELLESVK